MRCNPQTGTEFEAVEANGMAVAIFATRSHCRRGTFFVVKELIGSSSTFALRATVDTTLRMLVA
jgi:hypothetical protein